MEVEARQRLAVIVGVGLLAIVFTAITALGLGYKPTTEELRIKKCEAELKYVISMNMCMSMKNCRMTGADLRQWNSASEFVGKHCEDVLKRAGE